MFKYTKFRFLINLQTRKTFKCNKYTKIINLQILTIHTPFIIMKYIIICKQK